MMPLTSSSSSGSNVTERRREDGEARGEETGNDVMVGKKKNELSITITVVPIALVAQTLEILQIFPYAAGGNGQQRPLKGWKTHKKPSSWKLGEV